MVKIMVKMGPKQGIKWYTVWVKTEIADVYIPPNLDNPPEEHEISAAWILARNWNCLVTFLTPIRGYKVKTPDFVIRGVLWELKSPTGDSQRRCVPAQLHQASGQARSIIFDARRTKLDDSFLQAELIKGLERRRLIQRLVFITKSSEVIVLK